MEIVSISNLENKLDVKEITAKSATSKATLQENRKEIDILQLNDWQRSVVDIALKYLDNKSQVENNHPLSQGRFKQIQTLEEALKEVETLRKGQLKNEGLQAQANINPKDILSLFLQ